MAQGWKWIPPWKDTTTAWHRSIHIMHTLTGNHVSTLTLSVRQQPYSHSNVDSDEVLFYTGDLMSRAGSGIGQGSISLHPADYVHGPQPGSIERSMSAAATDETAVMLDTFAPLLLGQDVNGIEDQGYAWSWARGSGKAVTEDAPGDRRARASQERWLSASVRKR